MSDREEIREAWAGEQSVCAEQRAAADALAIALSVAQWRAAGRPRIEAQGRDFEPAPRPSACAELSLGATRAERQAAVEALTAALDASPNQERADATGADTLSLGRLILAGGAGGGSEEDHPGGAGGDIVFRIDPNRQLSEVRIVAGRGGAAAYPDLVGPNGSIRFHLADETEFLALSDDGAFVRGDRVDDNAAVYRAFLRWLRDAGLLRDPPSSAPR
jgi:hypothetical protein